MKGIDKNMSLGTRIKQVRLERGIKRKDLAEMLGITPSSISNYENGISKPRQQTLFDIIKVLGIDANYLYQDDAPGADNDVSPSAVSGYEYKYRALDERGRETVDRILDLEYSRAMDADKGKK